MTEIDISSLRPILEENIHRGRTALLPVLHAAQELYGYLPDSVAAEISRALHVPLADIYGVIDFYSLFYSQPVAKTLIHVCNDPVCAMAGADNMMKNMDKRVVSLEGTGAQSIHVERAPCLGLCEFAPALMVDGKAITGADKRSWKEVVGGTFIRPHALKGGDISILTANCGHEQTTRLESYVKKGGYRALSKAINMTREEIIAEIKASGLVGRGGAAFPTGLKWEGAARADGNPKYLVCNADEAEPGTFKDRVMLEGDPHRLLEGMLIAGYAIGSPKGFIYIRGEYMQQFQIVNQAIDEARSAGFLGDNIFGSGWKFDIEVRQGAGAYVCGEETALFESIEGKRGLPRVKPPFPTTHGLFGKPTVINNVETLCNVPTILEMGWMEYRKIGTEKSPGPKLFCLSGDVEKPGLYEVPFGVTFRHLLIDLAGGVRNGRKFKAALFGGAAGTFATEKDLDVKLSFEDLRAANLPLGSGVITVFDETRDLKDILLRLARFFADESCGKCYPCQLGTRRQYEIIQRVAEGNPLPDDMDRLKDIGWTMTDASICGLGQTAASAVLSGIKLWPEYFEQG